MKRRLAALIVALSVTALIALGVGSATANAAEKATATGKPIVTAAQVCGSKLTYAPHGHWTCAVKRSVAVRVLGSKYRPATASPATTTCDSFGNCWVRNSNTSALVNGGLIAYGDQDDIPGDDGVPITEVLGYTILNAAWSLSGTSMTEKGSFKLQETFNNAQMEDVDFSGLLTNGAPNVNGSEISRCSQESVAAQMFVGEHVDSPAGWCTLHDNANHDHFMFIQASWEDADFDGYWVAWVDSVVAHSNPVPATSYVFDAVNQIGGSRHWGGGWFLT